MLHPSSANMPRSSEKQEGIYCNSDRRERPWDEIVSRMHCTYGVVGGCQWEAQGEVPMSHSHKLLRTVRLGRLWTIKFKMHCMRANMMTIAHWWAMCAVVSGMSQIQILPQPHHLPYRMGDVFSSDLRFRTDTWSAILMWIRTSIQCYIHHLQICQEAQKSRKASCNSDRRERPWDEIVSRMHCTYGVVGGCQWEAQGEIPMSHSHKLLRTVRLGRLWTIEFKMHCMRANKMTIAHWWAMLAVVSGMSQIQILPQPHHLPYRKGDVFSSDLRFRPDTWSAILMWIRTSIQCYIHLSANMPRSSENQAGILQQW